MPVLTPGGAESVQPGDTLVIPTRRSDLQPTDNLIRCREITASSALPGSPAVAAVDGIPATAWVAAEAKATLTVKLAAMTRLSKVKVARGSREPFPYSVEVSSDGAHWKAVSHAPATAAGGGAGADQLSFTPVEARFLRLEFAGIQGAKAPNITEFEAF
jgi:hypothetical protein